MTDLNTAKINSLTQDVQQLRVRLDGISTEMDAFGSLICKIEGRLAALEDAENYRQQDEDAERAYEPKSINSLVDRVTLAISRCDAPGDWGDEIVNWTPEACIAIREVARWLSEQGTNGMGWSKRLEKEVNNACERFNHD